MRRGTWAVTAVVALTTAAATAGVIAMSSAQQPTPTAQEPSANTATVARGKLSDMVSLDGILTFRARSDGSPYAVINRARGIYTQLPEAGSMVDCGGVLYRVDDEPVLLLCGTVPAYRNLHAGDVGEDVRQLNRNLHALGDDAGVDINPSDNTFTGKTAKALGVLQRDRGIAVTGALGIGEAVVLPEPVRIAKLTGDLGGSAEPGALVLDATSDTPEVQLALDPSQPGVVRVGEPAQIRLLGNTSVTGTVDRIGSVAQVAAGQNADAATATIPAYIRFDHPEDARGFDAAPVQVNIATQGVEDVLSVPVTALVGKTGGGFAVEIVRPDGRHDLVAVTLGLFDTTGGRVQVEGDLVEGDHVVVPSP